VGYNRIMSKQPSPRYRDVMDPSREVSPTGRANECRVYFDGQFVGKTSVPLNLIGNERIGFVQDSFLQQPAGSERE
jgi:hypothetical protein